MLLLLYKIKERSLWRTWLSFWHENIWFFSHICFVFCEGQNLKLWSTLTGILKIFHCRYKYKSIHSVTTLVSDRHLPCSLWEISLRQSCQNNHLFSVFLNLHTLTLLPFSLFLSFSSFCFCQNSIHMFKNKIPQFVYPFSFVNICLLWICDRFFPPSWF